MAEPTIKIKRSSVPGKTPSTSNLSLGELGLNTYDGKLFLKQDQGGVGVGTTVITVNPWGVGVGSTGYNVYFTAGNVGIGTTNPTSALQVQGDARISGVVTAVGGFNIGIQSAGVNVVTDVITALNFVGTGNTFNYNSSTKTIDISISGAETVFSRTVTDFTATEGQTTFNVSYTAGYVDVYINGVYLDSSEYTATNGTSVVLNVGANAGDTVSIITYVTGGTLVSGVSDRTKTVVLAGAGQTQFSVTYINNNYLDVYLNGSKLNDNEYTATDGTTVGLNTGASLNDELEFVTYNPVYSDAVWTAVTPSGGTSSSIYRLNANVGIGTTNPSTKLHVVGTGSTTLLVEGNARITGILTVGSSSITIDGSNNRITIGSGITLSSTGSASFDNQITVGAGGTIITTTASGNVGIGTTIPLGTLQINSGTSAVVVSAGGSVGIGTTNPLGSLQVGAGSSIVLVTSTGSVGIGTDNPLGTLQVGAGTSAVVVSAGGSVSIGATIPLAKFYLDGGANNYTPSASGTGLFEVRGATSTYTMYIGIDDQGGYFGHNGSNRKLFFDVNETTRMTIDSSGNVGIGTTNPLGKLHVVIPTNGTALKLNNTLGGGGAYVDLDFDTYATSLAGYANAPATIRVIDDGSFSGHISFRTKGSSIGASQTEKVRITSSGNVGIGITNPQAMLELSANNNTIGGDARAANNRLRFTDTDTSKTSGQVNGGIEWYTGDNSDPGVYAYISSATDNVGDGVINFATGNATTIDQRMQLDDLGRLLINTTSTSPWPASTPTNRKIIISQNNDYVSIDLVRVDTSIGNGNIIGGFNFVGGENSAAMGEVAKIHAAAEENWTDSTNKTALVFETTAAGNVTSAEVARMTGEGYLRLKTGGIQFNGDTSAANALDDYEEGTWTPTITGHTLSGTTSGKYTKIGRTVVWWAQIVFGSSGNASAIINGLPFTVAGDGWSGYVAIQNSGINVPIHTFTHGNETKIYIRNTSNNDYNTESFYSKFLYIQGTYFVS